MKNRKTSGSWRGEKGKNGGELWVSNSRLTWYYDENVTKSELLKNCEQGHNRGFWAFFIIRR